MDAREGLAELAVVVGANVQPGQLVRVSADVVHAELVRAVADAAYRHGASYVEADFSDLRLRRSQVRHARGEVRGVLPAWWEAGLQQLADAGGARIMIYAPTAPGLFDDLDPARVSRAQPPRSSTWRAVEYVVNNTVIPGPNDAWASAIHPDLPQDEALSKLWRQIALACRLDQPDPAAAWRVRFAELRRRAETLTALGLNTVRLVGPGTDLRVGLLETARWDPPTNVNVHGIEHAWNLPSEEVYTVPDPERADGHVRLTRPAVVGERLVEDVELTFAAGRLTGVAGGDGIDTLREFIARDPGMSRLGELALVDGESAVGSVGQTFGMILLDENVAAHIALGFGFPELVDPSMRDRVNDSGDHLDVTVGSDEVAVVGHDRDGREHALIDGGCWQL
ncbi:MAG TPA: aminopeptidase [Solirubrobacteraceae bacterium]|nr:aminopeptidase [Solirubrobacteraceae bacterium]